MKFYKMNWSEVEHKLENARQRLWNAMMDPETDAEKMPSIESEYNALCELSNYCDGCRYEVSPRGTTYIFVDGPHCGALKRVGLAYDMRTAW